MADSTPPVHVEPVGSTVTAPPVAPPPASIDCTDDSSCNRTRPDCISSPMSQLPMKKKLKPFEQALHDEEEEEEEKESEEDEEEESSFRTWLKLQRSMGSPLDKVLSMLGLTYSLPEEVEEDSTRKDQHEAQVWEMLIDMGEEILSSSSTQPRAKLETINSLEDVLQLLTSATKIIVLTGAGISVSCGIPDFRSENGIYSRLQEYDLPNPQCMFDIEYFRHNPKPFYAFAKELFPKTEGYSYLPSKSHRFLKLLENKGKLLRIYSQNIDMLELAAGISEDLCILCHGSFSTATCLACQVSTPLAEIRADIAAQTVPICKACNEGVIKPDIVFFGEQLPEKFHDFIKEDQKETDLVLVMGSSLNVNPVRGIVNRIPEEIPMVLINREVAGQPNEFDVELLGYSDDILDYLVHRLGWEFPELPKELFDEELLREHNKEPDVDMERVEYEFIPPARYHFAGAIPESTQYSSSSSECSEQHDQEQVPPVAEQQQEEEYPSTTVSDTTDNIE